MCHEGGCLLVATCCGECMSQLLAWAYLCCLYVTALSSPADVPAAALPMSSSAAARDGGSSGSKRRNPQHQNQQRHKKIKPAAYSTPQQDPAAAVAAAAAAAGGVCWRGAFKVSSCGRSIRSACICCASWRHWCRLCATHAPSRHGRIAWAAARVQKF